MFRSRRIVILIGLALALIVPTIGPAHTVPVIAGTDPKLVREALWWALWAAVVLYVLAVERAPLASIGVRRPNLMTFVCGIGGGLVVAIGLGMLFAFVLPRLGLALNQGAFDTLYRTPLWFRVALVTRAAVVEETLFRGYGIERLEELTGRRWLAAVVTCAAFTLAHLTYWGPAHLLIAGGAAVILTALYLWRRDLICNILAHWTTDAFGLLLPHP